MAFGQGLSGLNAAAQELDIIGNNIANSGTIGFKASSVSFADVYANSKTGLGVQVAAVTPSFSAGIITGTGGPLDIAIGGANGLFRVQDSNGNVLYTRNGEFFSDKNNYIVNAQGQHLTGFPLVGTDPVQLQVPVGNIRPQPTTELGTKTNLDANAVPIDPALVPFNPQNPDSFTHSLPVTVFDSLGNAHQLMQYYSKLANDGNESVWEVNYRLDGQAPDDPVDGTVTMRFDGNGLFLSPASVAVRFEQPGAASGSPAADLDITMGYTGSTQFGGPFAPGFTQNGYATGEYVGLSIADDGAIVAKYTNDQSVTVGYLALAKFSNVQGLQPVGGNAWAESGTSGQPVLGRPGTNGLSMVKGGALENSNVDMGQELVNMIIAQRTYQANAQTIKTQDQVLQTLISLR